MAKIYLPKRSGKRSKVREKSVKSQGILKTILSGNPAYGTSIRTASIPGNQSELPQFREINQNCLNRQNSVESDHGCTSRIYIDKTGDTVVLMLYNVMLTLYSMTLTSQKPCFHVTSVIAAKRMA